ncbi:unnamed protein product [Phytophthora lilii]|uniref:Unnamed protein product n=1 Tax=Phytophthora lilii TaxID=2077276 RepID=A0A9W6XAD5_9STRA|nr:unnamed protein product [Phytophthora lilii]
MGFDGSGRSGVFVDCRKVFGPVWRWNRDAGSAAWWYTCDINVAGDAADTDVGKKVAAAVSRQEDRTWCTTFFISASHEGQQPITVKQPIAGVINPGTNLKTRWLNTLRPHTRFFVEGLPRLFTSQNKQLKKRKGSSRSDQHREPTALLPKGYITYARTLLCKYVFDRQTSSSEKRKHSVVSSTGCRVQINAVLRKVSEEYQVVVTGTGGQHNHLKEKRIFKHYFKNRRINDPNLLANVDEMRKSGASAKGILFYLREMSSKILYRTSLIHVSCSIESKWAKLKHVLKKNMDMAECVGTLLLLQHICEDDYESELLRVGTRLLPTNADITTLDTKSRNELEKLANIASTHAFKITCVRGDHQYKLNL